MAITSDQAAGDHFDPAEFDELLSTQGASALWRRARTCPCIDAATGAANIVCPFCRDLPGIVWDDGEFVTILAANRWRQDRADILGLELRGFTQFTFPSTITPGHLDLVVLQPGIMVVNDERLVRGETDKLSRSLERLRVHPALDVQFCEAIIDGQQAQYVFGVDFSVDDDGNITWLTDGPPSGVQYTLRYTALPTFVCWSPMSRDEGGEKMPYRVTVQRLDWFRRQAAGET